MVAFDADATAFADQSRDSAPVIVALPIGVDDVVAMRPAPWLATVDIGADGGTGVVGHDKAVRPAKAAIEKARVIRDVLHRGEQHRVQIMAGHDGPQARDALVVLGHCERQGGLVAIVAGEGLRTVGGIEHSQVSEHLPGPYAKRPASHPGVQDDTLSVESLMWVLLRRRHRRHIRTFDAK